MAGILVLSAAGCGGGQTPTEAPTTAAPAETTGAALQEDGAVPIRGQPRALAGISRQK